MRKFGAVAQLGEHLLCKQGVRSSILLSSTNKNISLLLHEKRCMFFDNYVIADKLHETEFVILYFALSEVKLFCLVKLLRVYEG